MFDIAASLLLCPIVLLGVLFGTLAPRIFQARLFTKRELPIVAMMLAIQAMIFIGALRGGVGLKQAGQSFVESGTYVTLLFVLPALITTRKEMLSLLRWIILCFLGVGLYGLYQHIFGFAKFEEDYAKSGLTMLIK